MGYYNEQTTNKPYETEQTTQNLAKQKQTSKPKNPDQSDMGYGDTKYKQEKKNHQCPTSSVEIPEEHHHNSNCNT